MKNVTDAPKNIPKELLVNADKLNAMEAIFVLFYFKGNEWRSYEQIIKELRDIGIPVKPETVERQVRLMCEKGFMTFVETEKKEGGGGSKPKVFRLSERGLVKADSVIRSILRKFVPRSSAKSQE